MYVNIQLFRNSFLIGLYIHNLLLPIHLKFHLRIIIFLKHNFFFFNSVLQCLPMQAEKVVWNPDPFWPWSRPVIDPHLYPASPLHFLFLPHELHTPAQQLQAVAWMWHAPIMHRCRLLSHIFLSLHLKCLDLSCPHLWEDSSSLKLIMAVIIGSNVSPALLILPQTTTILGIPWGQKLCHTSFVKCRVTDFNHYLLNKWRNYWMSFQIIKSQILNQLPLQ